MWLQTTISLPNHHAKPPPKERAIVLKPDVIASEWEHLLLDSQWPDIPFIEAATERGFTRTIWQEQSALGGLNQLIGHQRRVELLENEARWEQLDEELHRPHIGKGER